MADRRMREITEIGLTAIMQPCDSEPLWRHARDCAHCRERLEELRLLEMLRALPAPEPTAEFEARLLSRVRRQAQTRRVQLARRGGLSLWGWQLAAVASLVLVVLHLMPQWLGTVSAPLPTPPLPQLAVQEVRSLQVLLESPRPLAGATIRVFLPANVMLEGYGNLHSLQWQADIPAGGNRLSLPVRIGDGGAAGEILIEVEHGGARKSLRLPIEPAPVAPGANSITTI